MEGLIVMDLLTGRHKALLLAVLIVVALVSVAGCSTTKPYAEAFIGYRLGPDSGFESCSNENSGVRLGVERRLVKHVTVALEYEHVSHLTCGRPFNNKPESATNHVGVTFRVGGIQ
jgi:hypothetical protein